MLAGVLFLLLFGAGVVSAAEEKRWWEKRAERPDIYYPHEAHRAAMEQEGDPCLLCHPFGRNEVTDPERVKALTVIANEPLAAICHECHMERRSASWRCDLCHPDPTAIWPESHDFNYRRNHAEDVRLDERGCGSCHLDLDFCTDCHFGRDASRHHNHPLGYRLLHGVEARMDPVECGRCHEARYCLDCHREAGR